MKMITEASLPLNLKKRLTYIVNPTLAKFRGKLPEMELKETSLQQNEG